MGKIKGLNPEDFGHQHEHFVDADTLAGDVRDALLTHLRTIRVPWAMLAEDEQRDLIGAITKTADDMVRRAVRAIAERGFPHVEVIVGKTTLDKGIEMKLVAANTLDNVTKIASHGKMGAVLVLAEAATFLGERSPAKPDKDEPELPIDDERN